MIPTSLLVEQARHALWIAVALTLPAAIASAVASFVVATVQSIFQIHETAVANLARVLAVIAALSISGIWMGEELCAFAANVFALTTEIQRS